MKTALTPPSIRAATEKRTADSLILTADTKRIALNSRQFYKFLKKNKKKLFFALKIRGCGDRGRWWTTNLKGLGYAALSMTGLFCIKLGSCSMLSVIIDAPASSDPPPPHIPNMTSLRGLKIQGILQTFVCSNFVVLRSKYSCYIFGFHCHFFGLD